MFSVGFWLISNKLHIFFLLEDFIVFELVMEWLHILT